MSTPTIKQLVEGKTPVQVMFYDGEGMCAGILFGEHIICGCCGGIFDVYDVITMAQDEGVDAIRLFDTWVDVSEEIKGSDEDAATAAVVENGGYV